VRGARSQRPQADRIQVSPLGRHPGRVFTRRTLAAARRHRTTGGVSSATSHSHVRNIAAKLERVPSDAIPGDIYVSVTSGRNEEHGQRVHGDGDIKQIDFAGRRRRQSPPCGHGLRFRGPLTSPRRYRRQNTRLVSLGRSPGKVVAISGGAAVLVAALPGLPACIRREQGVRRADDAAPAHGRRRPRVAHAAGHFAGPHRVRSMAFTPAMRHLRDARREAPLAIGRDLGTLENDEAGALECGKEMSTGDLAASRGRLPRPVASLGAADFPTVCKLKRSYTQRDDQSDRKRLPPFHVFHIFFTSSATRGGRALTVAVRHGRN